MGLVPDEAAITRLVGAILLEQDDAWAVQSSRCMTPESPIGDEPPPQPADPGSPILPARSSRPKPVNVVALGELRHAKGHGSRRSSYGRAT